MQYIYTTEYYSATKKKKKNEIRKFTGKWKELGKILNEVNQTQKDKYGMYSLIYSYCTLTQ